MLKSLLIVSAVLSSVSAYSNTHPVVAWSSTKSYALDSLPYRLDQAERPPSLLNALFDSDDVCNHDAIVIIEHPGLHASDLRSLSAHGHVPRSLDSAISARQFPYIPTDTLADISSIADSVSSRCQSKLVQYEPGNAPSLQAGKKHTVCMKMPHVNQSGNERMEKMMQHDSTLGSELSTLASIFPDYLVVYAGSPLPPHLNKRQQPDVPDRPILDMGSTLPTFTASANWTEPTGGILHKYQILSPALITSLLVVFFMVVPLVLIGIKALSSIQSPLRVEAPKGFNAHERKTQ
ncbi:hypothetical protein CVT24_009077 [Panaeolus cyanescens]|uniref:Protein BIG1 n=1 Tax=Panaeolus cyanescens TaxID=181874 RepID=A0A409VAM9_9AGAR|nr:hypothetical protein CVT24_009077 [Panaeolus cyanescens]